MIVVTVASRGIGFVREAVVAHAFGVSREVDLFLVSLAIPAILITTVYYSIPNAFVPLWISSSSKQRQTVGTAIGVAIGSLIVAACIWWSARPAIRLLAGGFEPALQLRAVAILQIGAAAIVFAVIEALLRSRLLAAKSFALTGLSYVWQSLGIIGAAVWWRELGASALMWGLVIGTALSAIWNLALLASLGPRGLHASETPVSVMSSSRIWGWVTLVLLTDALSQLYAAIDRYLGSYLESGAIAALNYANLIAGLPAAIIGVALSTAILPFLSAADSASDSDRSRMIIDRTIRWALLFAIPITVWLLIFRSEVTAMLFQRGAFDTSALNLTSPALSAAALGIVPVALAAVWARVYYASRAWRPLIIIAVGALISKAIFSYVLVTTLGATGLALATSLAYLVAACISGYMQRDCIMPYLREWAGVAAKSLMLVGLPAITGLFIILWIVPEAPALRSLAAGGAMVTGLIALVFGGRRCGITQMDDLIAFLSPKRTSS